MVLIVNQNYCNKLDLHLCNKSIVKKTPIILLNKVEKVGKHNVVVKYKNGCLILINALILAYDVM